MATQSISFTGKLSLDETLDMHRYRSLCALRPSFRWFMGLFSALIAALLVGVIIHGKGTLQLWVILFLCAYFPVGWWYERRLMVRWQYRRHPEYYIENTFTVDENNVSLCNANMDMRLAWNQIAFLLDTPRGLMFMLPQIRVLCWLPQRLFEGNDFKEAVVGYANKNNVPVRTMK